MAAGQPQEVQYLHMGAVGIMEETLQRKNIKDIDC
jgi:hypothetical protein